MRSSAELFERYAWWASLKHGGLLISPSQLTEHFPADAPPLSSYLTERLRREVMRSRDGDRRHLPDLLDTTLEAVLGLDSGGWSKGPGVDATWTRQSVTREAIKPRRLWQGPRGALLPLFIDEGGNSRLGVGRGRRQVSRVVEWLRKADQHIALLTNGGQWRLIHAGAEYEAWCEWDVDLWFEEGRPGPQVTGLRLLLGADSLTPPAEVERSRLVAAILESRKGQAELSSVLGERVRLAVEHLIQASSAALDPLDQPGPKRVSRRDLYIAATRIVMRCVVILFAEARGLLPRDHPVYHQAYGFQGLHEQLERRAGGRPQERLRHAHGAWPRLQGLFRLVYHGSAHEALPVTRYGGGLFQPGDPGATNPVLRALAAFESPANAPTDATVHRILELLTRSQVKVRQGNRTTWVEAPVDFSDLSSEYIGILYEGLLDFELRRAGEDQPMVFLDVGRQPVLPLERLDAMSPKDMRELFEKLKKDVTKGPPSEEEAEEDEDEDESPEEEQPEDSEDDEAAADEDREEGDVDDAEESDNETADDDRRRIFGEMVEIWAKKAVRAAALVPYPQDDSDPRVRERYIEQEAKAAAGLIRRLVLPGEWFLVRWGGTRKGAGTFYTRPQLAGPTTRRTLQPLAYEPVHQETDPETRLVTVTQWKPRTPEKILELKVCDPAMGSGSFLVSALRFLADALVESLHFHQRFTGAARGTICRLADGLPADHPSQETLPVEQDHAEFEDRLRARLKRHIVERCLYGVDLDPLAVELGRMAMWVETLDPRLPFGFLDHKLKCGNALVGCWFDRFRDYPAMAWEREGGDKNHDRFVHHFREYTPTRGKQKGQTVRKGDKWTQAIKDFKSDVVRPQMADWIKARAGVGLPFLAEGVTPEGLHDEALAVFEELHALPVHETERREEVYREKIEGSAALQRLKLAFDTWCAIWFWPGDELEHAPKPLDFLQPPDRSRVLVAKLRELHRFFHWELEFPDVFSGEQSGFDALVGNPPWENLQPNPKEYFSNIDPLFRTYGRLQSLSWQRERFAESKEAERAWVAHNAGFKAFSNWVAHAADPFGLGLRGMGPSLTGLTKELKRLWRARAARRTGYSDPEHPFRLQIGRIFTYRLFVEQFLHLARQGGGIGALVPSGLHTDKWAQPLREYLLDECSWEWLFGFENREGIFDIHRSFKFGPVIVRKGGETAAIRAGFMHRDLDDWEEAESHILAYPRERVERFSPKSKAILEIRSERDLKILSKLYEAGVLLGEQGPKGWGIKYHLEFMMNTDADLFPPRPTWEAKGYRGDEYGHWLKGGWRTYDGPGSILKRPRGLILSADRTHAIRVEEIRDVALPLLQGGGIWQLSPFAPDDYQEHLEALATGPYGADAHYLMALKTYLESPKVTRGMKLGFRDISNATNRRTFVAAVVPDLPAGNTLAILEPTYKEVWPLSAVLSAFAFDWAARQRMGGTHLNYYIVEELPVLTNLPEENSLRSLIASLSMPHCRYAQHWLVLKKQGLQEGGWKRQWALKHPERLRRRCMIDAYVAEIFGLDLEDYRFILLGSDHPPPLDAKAANPKGFWRVDKDKDPELRHTVLSLIALHDLKEKGLNAFLDQNDGEGWMLPENLRLADYDLGHDDRAKQPQPVAAPLGPRFYDWQLEQSVEEAWEECERHAELISQIVPPVTQPSTEVAERRVAYVTRQPTLFEE